ncbi:hypothetical protein KJ996_06565, partial [Patescibacteria group bacterium]|nr:hypothetical protein [Patescibacteria group bacterium]
MIRPAHQYWHTLRRPLIAVVLAVLLVGLVPSGVWKPAVAQAAAGINKQIPYQGKVTDSSGQAMSDGNYNMRFKIFAAESGGSALWTETWDSGTARVTMTGGLFSVYLGTQTAITGVDFNSDSLWLQIEFDPGNDDTYEETFSPRRRFGSVPYAFNADQVDGLEAASFLRADSDDTATGSITFSNADIGVNVQG